MDIEIYPSLKLEGKIQAPPSKSYTHRAVFMGALAKGRTIIRSPLISRDTNASMNAMSQLGAKLSRSDDHLVIEGIKRFQVPEDVIDVDNSGTTMRFLTALSAHLPGTVKLTGDPSIQNRPMGPLLEALLQVGIQCFSESGDGTPPIIIKGGTFKTDHISIPGNISSQFISGLLISAPLAHFDITIELTTPPKSSPYLAITIEMLQKFGIKHTYDPDQRIYHIVGNQTYQPIDFTIPGDFSSAAYFLTAGALLDSNITISNLDINDPQGDKEIVELLKTIGAILSVNTSEKSINIKRRELKAFQVDVSNIPDLVPILAVVASFIPGKSKLINASHLRLKESDRLHTITTELRKMKVDIEELSDGLIINGTSEHKGAILETYNDHRIAMALVIASLPLKEKTLIKNIDCINVSYPNFLKDLEKLGGNFRVINE